MQRKKNHNSIDGMSSRPATRFGQPVNRSNFQSQGQIRAFSDTKKTQANSLDNLSRKDGFYASGNPLSGGTPRPVNSRSDSTIVLETPQSKKARRGLFRKKKKSYNQSSKKGWSLKRKIITTIAVILIIVLGVGGYLFAKGYIAFHKVFQGGGGAAALEQNVDPSKLNGEGDGRVNILLLGRGGDGHEGPDLTDTLILASIDPVSKEASLLSIPRDLYVKTPNYGSTKINAVFAYGKEAALKNQRIVGPQQIKDAEAEGFKAIESVVSDTMGVPIHYHLMVDFSGFQQAVDNVGGVEINAPNAVAENMYNEATGKHFYLNVKPGLQHMDGQTALFYARSRHTSARGDFDRSERQRALISALKDKIISPSTFSNPQKISNLISTFGNHVQTNFSAQDLQRLAQISKEIPSDKIHSLGLSDPPNNYIKTATINGLSVVVPTAGNFNFKDIQYYVRNALKDSYLKSESANIMVLNGANKAGLASEKSQELKSYGYTITKVDNAPTRNYQKTIIVDLRNGQKKYTKNYLEKRFGVTAVSSVPDPAIVPDASTDFVIILGSDQANTTN